MGCFASPFEGDYLKLYRFILIESDVKNIGQNPYYLISTDSIPIFIKIINESKILEYKNNPSKDLVDAYEKNAYYVRVICELIGSENYLTAFGDHDYNELIGYLANYSSRRDADSLISSINSACTDTRMNTESDQDAREILEEIYFNKNGVSVEESNDNVMKCYFNKLFQTEYEIEGARFAYHASVNKNYLVNTDMVPNITFSKQNKLYGTVYLGDNNEVVSGEVLAEGFYNEVGEVVDLDGNEIEEEIISYTR